MAFNSRDFISLAKKLQKVSGEAELRTAVGRPYYGVFNFVIEKLKTNGIRFSSAAEDHEKLVRYLTNCGIDEIQNVGMSINDLRGVRNNADYKMAISFQNSSDVAFNVMKAEIAMNNFEKKSLGAIVNGIKEYKKKINEPL